MIDVEKPSSLSISVGGKNEKGYACTSDSEIVFPVFSFDGKTHTDISVTDKNASVSYKGYKYLYHTDGTITDKKALYANGNGLYNALSAVGTDKVCLKIEII